MMQKQDTFRGILPGFRSIARLQQDVDTDDIAVARNSLVNTYNPHHFTVPGHRRFHFRHQKLCLNTVSINDLYYSNGGTVDVEDVKNIFCIMFPLHGVQKLETGNEQHLLTPGSAFAVGPSYPVRQFFSSDYRMLSVRVSLDRLEKFLLNEFESCPGVPFEFDRNIVALSPATAHLVHFIRYICEATIDIDEDPYDEIIAEYTERSLLAMLLKSFPNSYSNRFSAESNEPGSLVMQAEQFIRANLGTAIGAKEIAAAVKVSVRTLYYAFTKYRAWTPVEYLKMQRLKLARELLVKSEHTSTTVTDIAYNCGFNHLGKFSHDYAFRFGELPRETLRRSCNRDTRCNATPMDVIPGKSAKVF